VLASDRKNALQMTVVTSEFRMVAPEQVCLLPDRGPNDGLKLFPFGAIGPETGFRNNGPEVPDVLPAKGARVLT
jgi:hypothetical protein